MTRAALAPSARAAGKVILLGEHAVVYGAPALAAALPDALRLDTTPLADPDAPNTLRVPAWRLELALDADHPVAAAARAVFAHCKTSCHGWAIRGVTDLLPGAGLGSSAALTVALARLCLGDADPDFIVAASLAGEAIFHGTPSGVDSALSARGGVLRFARGQAPTPAEVGRPTELWVVPSGLDKDTRVQVAKVRARREAWPEIIDPLVASLGAATERGAKALAEGDLETLGALFDLAHGALSALGVSSPGLDRVVLAAREAGALGAKLTGGGGGGSILALAPPGPHDLEAAMLALGLSPFRLTLVPATLSTP